MSKIEIPRTKDLFNSQKLSAMDELSKKYSNLPPIKLSEYKTELSKAFSSSTPSSSALFDYDDIFRESTPLILSPFSTEGSNKCINTNISRLIFRTFKFNMMHFGMELKFTFTLKTNSSFWAFTRSNEDIFDPFSSSIQVSVTKENNVYFSYGNFIRNGKSDLIYRCFMKEQLALPKPEENIFKVWNEEETGNNIKEYEFKIHVIDTCNDQIVTVVEWEKTKFEFEANWYWPVNGYKNVMFGGTGSDCKISEILIKNYEVNTSKLVKNPM